MPTVRPSWRSDAAARIAAIASGAAEPLMPDANAETIQRALRGMGPDGPAAVREGGAHIAVNMPAVHVPAFCAKTGDAYLNTYALGKTARLGDVPPGTKVPTRTLVDALLAQVTGHAAHQLWFGAIELNGSGIRFYGDVCLILGTDPAHDGFVVLESNSYDLVRPPKTPRGDVPDARVLLAVAIRMAGLFGTDLPEMAVLKVVASRGVAERRLTTGQISGAVLDDEDYLEVLMTRSFDTTALQEARLSAGDAAAHAQITEQLRHGPCPTLAELTWRKHRNAAIRALQSASVSSRVVNTVGRMKS